MMGGEEYANYRSKRELENFIDSAQIAATGEEFNIDEYFPKEEEPAEEDAVAEEISSEDTAETVETAEEDAFRPLDFKRE